MCLVYTIHHFLCKHLLCVNSFCYHCWIDIPANKQTQPSLHEDTVYLIGSSEPHLMEENTEEAQ